MRDLDIVTSLATGQIRRFAAKSAANGAIDLQTQIRIFDLATQIDTVVRENLKQLPKRRQPKAYITQAQQEDKLTEESEFQKDKNESELELAS